MVDLPRRKALALSGTAVVGGIGLREFTQPASAASDVSFGAFSLPDQTFYPNGTVQNVTLAADVKYTWTVNRTPDRYTVDLSVGTQESDLTSIDSIEQTDIPSSDTRTDTLKGSLLDSPDYELSLNFQPSDGGEKQTNVWAQTTFKLFNNGSEIATSSATTQATIIMKDEDLVVSSDIGASGEFGVTETSTS